jgi:hypothetical protein
VLEAYSRNAAALVIESDRVWAKMFTGVVERTATVMMAAILTIVEVVSSVDALAFLAHIARMGWGTAGIGGALEKFGTGNLTGSIRRRLGQRGSWLC